MGEDNTTQPSTVLADAAEETILDAAAIAAQATEGTAEQTQNAVEAKVNAAAALQNIADAHTHTPGQSQ